MIFKYIGGIIIIVEYLTALFLYQSAFV